MIKVIEENDSVLLGICPSCLSKITLEHNDLIYLYDRSETLGVKCPVCGDNITTSNIEKVTVREVKIIESNLKESDD